MQHQAKTKAQHGTYGDCAHTRAINKQTGNRAENQRAQRQHRQRGKHLIDSPTKFRREWLGENAH